MAEHLDRETLMMLLDPRSPLKGRSPPPYASKFVNVDKSGIISMMPRRFVFHEEPQKEYPDAPDATRQ